MPFKIWQHPQGEMTVNEYVRRLAEQDRLNIQQLKKSALEGHEVHARPARKKKSKSS